MKNIVDRGRTLDAVVNPKNYHPFSKIPDKETFEIAWKSNPDWVFANMAHAAYLDQEYLQKLFSSFGAKIKFYKSKADENGIIMGREAFLATWDDKAILSFRGTEASEKVKIIINEKFIKIAKKHFNFDLVTEVETLFPADILDDAAFVKGTYIEAGGKSDVHGGFYKSTLDLWTDIVKDLDNLSISDPTQLFVTGHSLGAAMAVIAAMMYTFKEVVTFGEPCVGNDIDNTIEKCIHTRFVNGDDPVTRIIPEIVYEHHGNKINIQDINGADIKFDHSIINYAEILGEGRYLRQIS